MAYRFPESAIEEVLSSIDIVEVLSEYLVLKKSGSNYKALCPFHRERTPSFTVSSEKQMFYCFGCQTGGNVFTFLMKHESMTFVEVVRMLAERAGIALPAVDRGEQEKTLSLMNINKVASDFFHRCLVTGKAGEKAREYLKRRKIGENIISAFQLGYAPPGDGLLEELRRKNCSQDSWRDSGLLTSDKKRVLFYKRLIFPIFNVRGKVIGFGGRVLDNSQPKYINSPETPLYHKSRTLYGLNFAKEHIRSEGKAVIVEGYIDLIRVFQSGVKNVVASLGTSLTGNSVKDQAYLLRRYTKEVLMVYDADKAGVLAALRSLDLFVENGFRVGVVSLPLGNDPDDFIMKRGGEAFAEEINRAKNLLDYKLGILTSKHDPFTVEGRVEIVSEMLPTISKIGNAVERSEYVKALAQCLSIEEEAVSTELKKLKSHKRKGKAFTSIETQGLAPFVIERTLLQFLLEDGEVLKQVKDDLNPEDFSHSDYRCIYEVILEIGSSEPQKVMSRLQDEKFSRLVAQLLVKPVPFSEKKRAVRDCIEKVKKQRIKRRRSEIQKQIEEKESEGDMKAVRALLLEYQGLIRSKL